MNNNSSCMYEIELFIRRFESLKLISIINLDKNVYF
jgi:hypothetical protein